MFFSSASPCFFPVMIFFCSSSGIFQQNSVYSNTWLPQDNSLVLLPIRHGTRMTPHLAFAGQVSLLALNEMGRYRSYRTSGVLPTYLCQAAWESVSQITQFFPQILFSGKACICCWKWCFSSLDPVCQAPFGNAVSGLESVSADSHLL